MKIGPRKLYLLDPATGRQEAVSIHLTVEFTNGEPWQDDPLNITGQVQLEGGGCDMTLKAFAADEIQAVGRLVKLAGAALLGACERDGRQLWTPDRPHALDDPLQIF